MSLSHQLCTVYNALSRLCTSFNILSVFIILRVNLHWVWKLKYNLFTGYINISRSAVFGRHLLLWKFLVAYWDPHNKIYIYNYQLKGDHFLLLVEYRCRFATHFLKIIVRETTGIQSKHDQKSSIVDIWMFPG